MSERINDKIEEVEGYLIELENEVPDDLEEYIENRRVQLICERLFEIISEGFVDLAFIFIKENKLEMPSDDEGAFDVLIENKIISSELGKRLQDARRMRNVIAHKYGVINNELVYNSIKYELPRDIRDFIKGINREGK